VSGREMGKLYIEGPRMILLALPLITLYFNCRFFRQNINLVFNKSTMCFGYRFITIIWLISSIKKEGNNTLSIMVGDLGPYKVLYRVYN